jgi:hypothetical protein
MRDKHSPSYPARWGRRLYKEVAGMSKWVSYEQLKAELRAGKLTPAQYEQAIKKLVKELRL